MSTFKVSSNGHWIKVEAEKKHPSSLSPYIQILYPGQELLIVAWCLLDEGAEWFLSLQGGCWCSRKLVPGIIYLTQLILFASFQLTWVIRPKTNLVSSTVVSPEMWECCWCSPTQGRNNSICCFLQKNALIAWLFLFNPTTKNKTTEIWV